MARVIERPYGVREPLRIGVTEVRAWANLHVGDRVVFTRGRYRKMRAGDAYWSATALNDAERGHMVTLLQDGLS